MKNPFRILLFAVAFISICLCLTSCFNLDPVAQQKIDDLVAKNQALADKLTEAYRKFDTGKLTAQEVKDIVEITQSEIAGIKVEIEKLLADGTGTGTIILMTALSMLGLTGGPSKRSGLGFVGKGLKKIVGSG